MTDSNINSIDMGSQEVISPSGPNRALSSQEVTSPLGSDRDPSPPREVYKENWYGLRKKRDRAKLRRKNRKPKMKHQAGEEGNSSGIEYESDLRMKIRDSESGMTVPLHWFGHEHTFQSGSETNEQYSFASSLPEIIHVSRGFMDVVEKAPDFWTAVKNHKALKYDNIVGYVEGVLQLLVILTDENVSTKAAISAVMLYAKTLIGRDKSLILSIGEYVETLFMTSQSNGSTFLDALSECRNNWKLFKDNKLFKKFSNLLTLLVSLGICEATTLSFSIGSMKIIEARAQEVQMSAFDVTDAIFDTLAFFIEGGYRCFQAGSLKPLLYDDVRVHALEDEYIMLSRMWDLQQNGNLLKMEGVEASEFDNRLENCISSFKRMLPSFSGLDKKIISDKYNKLLQIKSDYVLSRLAGGTRRAPWTVELFGESSQGKSTVGDYLLDGMLMSANLSTDKIRRAVLNASSRFMDTWKTDTLVAILDDMCNEKSGFVEKPPTRWVIDLCNNQTFYAPKAEIEAKGKVFVEPEIVLINTNKKDLDAYTYSNCPYSVQRRAHIVATIKAKTMFQNIIDGVECGLSAEKVKEYYETHDQPVVEDLWNINVEVAIKPTGKLDQLATYTPFVYKGKEMMGIGMNEFLEMNIDLFQKHRARQYEIINKSDNSAKMQKCGIDGCCNVKGVCSCHTDYVSLPSFRVPEYVSEDEGEKEETPSGRRGFFGRKPRAKKGKRNMKKQYGEQVASVIHNGITSITSVVDREAHALDGLATKGLYLAASYFTANWDWLSLVPAPVWEMDFAQRLLKYYTKDIIVQRINSAMWATIVLTTCLSIAILYTSLSLYPFVLLLWIIALHFMRSVYVNMEKWIMADITRRSKIMYPVLEKFKNDNYKYIVGVSVAAFSVMALRCIYKSYCALQPKQGNIEKPTQQAIEVRDAEKNPYVEVMTRPLPITGKGRTITGANMDSILNNNLLYGSVYWGENDKGEEMRMMVNPLMVDTNIMILPKHYFDKGDTTMICKRNNPDTLGGTFEVRLDVVNTVDIEDSELTVVYVAEGGSYKNITDYLIDTFPTDHGFYMKYRQKDGTFLNARGKAIANPNCNNGTVFTGVEYFNLTMNTFGGLCGAVLYSAGIGCNITGIHVGGIDGAPVGCASIPRKSQVLAAIEKLRKRKTCIKTASDSDFPEKQFGIEFMTKEPLHAKSPLNFLPEGSTIQYHGACIGKTTSHSDAKKTLISDIVAAETGIFNKWRGPVMKPEWKGWQDCLANISKPGLSMPYALLEHCAEDYIEPLLEVMEDRPFWKEMRPLTDEENLLGVPGKKFMDAIKKATAIGYPLTGPKAKFLEELEATMTYPHNFKLTDEIMKEIIEAESRYARGERAYPVAKACKKDEILPKEKCRIFYGNSITLTWLIRKYYLPLIRFLQMNPLLSECAVGINCHSKEWDQLYQYLTKFDRLIGGDYKKYDQKLPAQLIITAFRIMISLAEKCDYSERDLKIMEAMVADIVYAYIAFNGDLVSLTCGTHISGNSLTVIINGICGALNLRAAFFSNNPTTMKFRDHVALSTYGDDNLGSVSNECNFSIKIASEFLAKYGQTYTMPNKESEISEFLRPEDFEFLKRQTVYIPEIDCHVGALQTDSIYKSLHMYLRGKSCENSEEEACALNLDTAVREFFNHGREVYESQRATLKNIATKANLNGFCAELDVSFDDRVIMWKEKYDPDSLDPPSETALKAPPRMTHGVAEAVEDVPDNVITVTQE